MKRYSLVSGLFLILCFSFSTFQTDRGIFYKALSATSEGIIDDELKELDRAKPSSQTSAYQGALLMKKAGFEKGVKGKLKTFKAGAKLLEAEIEKNPSNVEYRFLRLTIQEHAPGILNYNKKLEEDKASVIAGYEKLDPVLKSVILDFAQSSKVLKKSDLK
jgi:hypothetical protein